MAGGWVCPVAVFPAIFAGTARSRAGLLGSLARVHQNSAVVLEARSDIQPDFCFNSINIETDACIQLWPGLALQIGIFD